MNNIYEHVRYNAQTHIYTSLFKLITTQHTIGLRYAPSFPPCLPPPSAKAFKQLILGMARVSAFRGLRPTLARPLSDRWRRRYRAVAVSLLVSGLEKRNLEPAQGPLS